MTKYDKLQTILMANSIYAMYAMMDFHCTMTVGAGDCTHEVNVTVFWHDDYDLRAIRDQYRGLLRDGDEYQEQLHNDPSLEGGWCSFILKFK